MGVLANSWNLIRTKDGAATHNTATHNTATQNTATNNTATNNTETHNTETHRCEELQNLRGSATLQHNSTKLQ